MRNYLRTIVAAGMVLASISGARAQVAFNWVTVGDAGNAPDPLNAGTTPGIGSVGHEYRIVTHEVTNGQYVEFLNSVDPTGLNPNAVYHTSMGSAGHGGISFN